MSKTTTLLILTFLLPSLIVLNVSTNAQFMESAKANSTTITVSTTDYPTIQEAINKANASDTITVKPGIYYEHINVTKQIKLMGEDPTTTIIDGEDKNQSIVTVLASNVDITGFTIQNAGMEFTLCPSGIRIMHNVSLTICNNIIRNNYYGIFLSISNSCDIIDNTIIDNYIGVQVSKSSSNRIIRNNIRDNTIGARVGEGSQYNVLYHNNFINNFEQIEPYGSSNTTWDNGAEGNYWTDYAGVDLKSGPNQNETGSDGIGDTPYPDELSRWDKYPLMGPINRFEAGTWNGITYHVNTVSNSTVSDFHFNPNETFISFNVTGSDHTIGFCRVTFPEDLLWVDDPEQWQVFVNGTSVSRSVWRTMTENGNHTCIYFTYNYSIQNVQIQGVYAIPEFPTALLLPIFMIATLIAIILVKRREPNNFGCNSADSTSMMRILRKKNIEDCYCIP